MSAADESVHADDLDIVLWEAFAHLAMEGIILWGFIMQGHMWCSNNQFVNADGKVYRGRQRVFAGSSRAAGRHRRQQLAPSTAVMAASCPRRHSPAPAWPWWLLTRMEAWRRQPLTHVPAQQGLWRRRACAA